MKKGPPKNDMIIPTGISNGANKVRDAISQNKTNTLPINEQTGISILLSFSTMNLPAWGIISPIKPNKPAKLIALPASSEDKTRNKNRYLDTLSPRDFAVSSPKDNIFISALNIKDSANAVKISIPGSFNLSKVTPDSPPIKNDILLIAVSGQRVSTVSVMAPTMLDTATPAKTIVILDAPVFLAMK